MLKFVSFYISKRSLAIIVFNLVIDWFGNKLELISKEMIKVAIRA